MPTYDHFARYYDALMDDPLENAVRVLGYRRRHLPAAGHPRRQSFLPDWRRADRSQTANDVWAACRFLRLQGGWHDVQAQVAVQTGRCISRQSMLSP